MEEATQIIMANGAIENFIREEAARYSLIVLEFTEGQSLAVYTDGCDANNDVKGIEIEEFPKTLGDLAKTDHLFYRFSQSSPGRSEEKVFAQYIPGQITEAKDNEKYLSFVTEKTIASCFI